MSKAKSTLDLLFDSQARVKILKFLFRNMVPSFTAKDLAVRTQESISVVNIEIKRLIEVGLLKIRR